MTKRIVDQEDRVVAERYRLLIQRKNKRQKERYHEKSRGKKRDRLLERETKRKILFERGLDVLVQENKEFTTNLNFLQFLRQHVYTQEDKGCHITMEHMKNYRLQNDIKTQLQRKKQICSPNNCNPTQPFKK